MAGTPLLLSDIAANRDLGFPSHHYFRKGDVAALARRLAEPHAVFTLRDRTALSAFHWDVVCRETDAVYTAAMA